MKSSGTQLVRPLRPLNHQLFLPFHHPEPSHPTPVYFRIPLQLLGFILLPIRLTLGTFLVFLSFLIAILLPQRPALLCFSFLARSILFTIGFHHIQTVYDEDFDERSKTTNVNNLTVVSNHVSMVDPLLCIWGFHPGFVAKASVKHIPLIGPVAQALGSLFVDRVSGNGHITEQLSKRQHDTIGNKGRRLVVYPEGTTTNGRFLLRFRTGAFVSGLPILPIIFRYPFQRFSPTYETMRWWKFLVGLLMEPYNCVEVIQMPVYYPNEEEKKDPRLYADNVRQRMADRINVDLSDATFADKLELLHIIRGGPLPKHLKAD